MTDAEAAKRKARQRINQIATYKFFSSFFDRLTVALWAIAVLSPIFGLGGGSGSCDCADPSGGPDLWIVGAGFLAGLVTLLIGIFLARLAASLEKS